MSTGDALTRMTAYLTARGATALAEASHRTGDSLTDTLNRALAVYAILVERADREGVTEVTLPWDDRPLHLKVSRAPFPKRKWLPW